MPYVLRLTSTVKHDATELIHHYLREAGTTGTSELPSGEIIAGFENEAQAQQAGVIVRRQTPGTSWITSTEEVDPTTWEPFTTSTSITVRTPNGLTEVQIEANQVFGHGKHPTTQLMLEMIGQTVDDKMRVLDVGTGSGVLAIAAAVLGAAVEAIDIDEQAVATAQANALKNDVDLVCSTTPLADIASDPERRFDVVVSNVLLPVHNELYNDVLAVVKPNGIAMLAGFLDSQETVIRQLYQPFQLVGRNQILDWVGLGVRPTRRY